jgi:hypothetical protein
VLASIHLNDQLLLETNEIDNEFTYGLLPSEFESFNLPGPKLIPQNGLSERRPFPQIFSCLCQIGGHEKYPLPLPPPARGGAKKEKNEMQTVIGS